MQVLAMHNLLNIDTSIYAVDPERRHPYPTNGDIYSVCKYTQVTCTGGLVTKIKWENTLSRPLEISTGWLPRSVTNVCIKGEHVLSPFETRTLPPQLSHARLEHCRITGTVSLQTLPESLETMNLAGNFITGAVRLQGLPPNLKRISLARNRVKAVYGPDSYEGLPEKFIRGNFSPTKPKNKVLYIAEDGQPMDKRIVLDKQWAW